MRVHVEGRDHMADGATYLVMSNHQSLYDVPVIFYVIGPNVRMITKVELFSVPIFGPALREAGFIAVDRSNRAKAIASLAIAKETLASGVHVWIAPEGTRSRTGELLPFKKGGFALALETGLPIRPVSVRGTRDALRAKGPGAVPRKSKGGDPIKQLTDPLVWELVRKLAAHKKLRDEVAKLAAGYSDPAEDKD